MFWVKNCLKNNFERGHRDEPKTMDKKVVMIGMVIGSLLGGWLPTFFGASAFGIVSIIGGLVGGVLGIWLTYRLMR
jgi:hypothetical protein